MKTRNIVLALVLVSLLVSGCNVCPILPPVTATPTAEPTATPTAAPPEPTATATPTPAPPRPTPTAEPTATATPTPAPPRSTGAPTRPAVDVSRIEIDTWLNPYCREVKRPEGQPAVTVVEINVAPRLDGEGEVISGLSVVHDDPEDDKDPVIAEEVNGLYQIVVEVEGTSALHFHLWVNDVDKGDFELAREHLDCP